MKKNKLSSQLPRLPMLRLIVLLILTILVVGNWGTGTEYGIIGCLGQSHNKYYSHQPQKQQGGQFNQQKQKQQYYASQGQGHGQGQGQLKNSNQNQKQKQKYYASPPQKQKQKQKYYASQGQGQLKNNNQNQQQKHYASQPQKQKQKQKYYANQGQFNKQKQEQQTWKQLQQELQQAQLPQAQQQQQQGQLNQRKQEYYAYQQQQQQKQKQGGQFNQQQELQKAQQQQGHFNKQFHNQQQQYQQQQQQHQQQQQQQQQQRGQQQQQQQQQQPQLSDERMKQMQAVQADFMQNPRDAEKRFNYGWFLLLNNGMDERCVGILQSCFDIPGTVDQRLDEFHPMKGYYASHFVGRYLQEQKDYKNSNKFLQIAYDVSKQHLSPNHDVSELCVALQLATQFDSFPLSIDHADYALQKMEYYQTELLQLIDPDQYRTYNQDAAMLNEQWLSKTIPGVIQDPYVHCVNDLFTLSFYYRANVTKIASQHYKLVSLAWPGLNYIAQHVHQYKKDAAIAAKFASSNNYHHQKCIDRKIRLGVISATVTQGHSVSEDFGGVLEHLDRSKFQVTYIQVHEKSTPANSADFLTAHPDVDELFHYFKNPQTDTQNGAWIKDRIGIQEIEQKFQFDIILYLDLTMSSFMKRLGMMKLAPVQINTHGHPMTSGHPSTIIDHFISWGEAELPIEISQSHYTEQLQLIPKGKIHQYYTPRVITEETQKIVAGGGSETKTILRNRLNGQRFDHLTRKDYELPPYLQNSDLSDGRYNVYTCMQIPFKLHPEFDELVCGILNRDTNGHAILHKEVATNHHKTFVERLKQAGCDMDRVHFLSRLPQHELSQLYRLSNVVLDSYPAGGCTTTRDVLENGKVVVTWPARLLGGRWTLALYNIIGLDETTKSALIASSAEEYILKAVKIGTDPKYREQLESKILERIPTLFYRKEAIEEWEKILLKVSPVKQCSGTITGNSVNDDDDDDYEAGSGQYNDEL